jgi:hypothetical protein
MDAALVCRFFTAQMEAARLVQQADFEHWQANKQKPFADTTSLAVLRQRIDQLNRELIDALTEVRPRLFGQTVQQVLPRRAEEVLTGNGLAGVRETAIAPLRATPPWSRAHRAPQLADPRGAIRDQGVLQSEGGIHELGPRIPRRAAGCGR